MSGKFKKWKYVISALDCPTNFAMMGLSFHCFSCCMISYLHPPLHRPCCPWIVCIFLFLPSLLYPRLCWNWSLVPIKSVYALMQEECVFDSLRWHILVDHDCLVVIVAPPVCLGSRLLCLLYELPPLPPTLYLSNKYMSSSFWLIGIWYSLPNHSS